MPRQRWGVAALRFADVARAQSLYTHLQDKRRKSNSVPLIGVLVVDDHPMARSGITALLESEDGIMVVAEAESGKEGLERFRSFRPDVAVIDVNLPDLDGWETTERLTEEFPDAKGASDLDVRRRFRPKSGRRK